MEKYKKTLVNFINILQNIKAIRKNREDCINEIFWEYNNCNIDQLEDTESKIKKYLPNKIVYPKSFLASNIGFSKTKMDPRCSDILNKFGLEKKSTSGSLRNALHYDILKHLIMKYLERSRK